MELPSQRAGYQLARSAVVGHCTEHRVFDEKTARSMDIVPTAGKR